MQKSEGEREREGGRKGGRRTGLVEVQLLRVRLTLDGLGVSGASDVEVEDKGVHVVWDVACEGGKAIKTAVSDETIRYRGRVSGERSQTGGRGVVRSSPAKEGRGWVGRTGSKRRATTGRTHPTSSS